MLANRLGDVRAQLTLSRNNLLMIVEPAACELQQSLPITGPEALSYADMMAKIGAAVGRSLRFEPISTDEGRRKMVSRGEPEEIIAAHLSIYRAIREGRLAAVTDTVERVLGRKPIAFDQWVRENVAAFLGITILR